MERAAAPAGALSVWVCRHLCVNDFDASVDTLNCDAHLVQHFRLIAHSTLPFAHNHDQEHSHHNDDDAGDEVDKAEIVKH